MSVTPQSISDYIKNFPFPTLRDKQSYVLKEIDAAFTSGYKGRAVEVPVVAVLTRIHKLERVPAGKAGAIRAQAGLVLPP